MEDHSLNKEKFEMKFQEIPLTTIADQRAASGLMRIKLIWSHKIVLIWIRQKLRCKINCRVLLFGWTKKTKTRLILAKKEMLKTKLTVVNLWFRILNSLKLTNEPKIFRKLSKIWCSWTWKETSWTMSWARFPSMRKLPPKFAEEPSLNPKRDYFQKILALWRTNSEIWKLSDYKDTTTTYDLPYWKNYLIFLSKSIKL